MLKTYVATSSISVLAWADRRWNKEVMSSGSKAEAESEEDTTEQPEGDWWAVKASAGNGGGDVYFINSTNYKTIIPTFPRDMEYVIQKYVMSPLLYQKKKFHFRCYSTMHADGMAMVYDMGFVLCCGVPYDANSNEPMSHITNLSANKRMADHPGQIPSFLPANPNVFEQICDIWAAVVNEAYVYMSEQRSQKHFEFFGLDIIVDRTGKCWLIEINRLPGLESSNNHMKEDEDIMYDNMMTKLLDIVLENKRDEEWKGQAKWNVVRQSSNQDMLGEKREEEKYENKERNEKNDDGSGALNILRWKLFTRHIKDKVVVDIKLV